MGSLVAFFSSTDSTSQFAETNNKVWTCLTGTIASYHCSWMTDLPLNRPGSTPKVIIAQENLATPAFQELCEPRLLVKILWSLLPSLYGLYIICIPYAPCVENIYHLSNLWVNGGDNSMHGAWSTWVYSYISFVGLICPVLLMNTPALSLSHIWVCLTMGYPQLRLRIRLRPQLQLQQHLQLQLQLQRYHYHNYRYSHGFHYNYTTLLETTLHYNYHDHYTTTTATATLHYTALHPAVVGDVTTATTPKSAAPQFGPSVALPSMHHNNSPLL